MATILAPAAVPITANTLIRDAMIEIGAAGMSDTLPPDDSGFALRALNRMLDAWRLRNLLAYHVAWVPFTLTSAMQTRTIGPGGDVDTTRPVRIEVGSFTRFGGIDRVLNIASRDQWAANFQKTTPGASPEWVYYEASAPLGVLHFWPQGDCEVHLALQTPIAAFVNLTTYYALQPGYERAIVLSLAEELCRPFGRPTPDKLPRDAANARRAIENANFEVPQLDIGNRGAAGYPAFIAG